MLGQLQAADPKGVSLDRSRPSCGSGPVCWVSDRFASGPIPMDL